MARIDEVQRSRNANPATLGCAGFSGGVEGKGSEVQCGGIRIEGVVRGSRCERRKNGCLRLRGTSHHDRYYNKSIRSRRRHCLSHISSNDNEGAERRVCGPSPLWPVQFFPTRPDVAQNFNSRLIISGRVTIASIPVNRLRRSSSPIRAPARK